MNPNVQKLNDLLGYDPIKSASPVFTEVAAELAKERAEEGKKRAKELILKAIELRRAFDSKEREFRKLQEKFDKELGQIMRQIDAAQRGAEAPVEAETPATDTPTS